MLFLHSIQGCKKSLSRFCIVPIFGDKVFKSISFSCWLTASMHTRNVKRYVHCLKLEHSCLLYKRKIFLDNMLIFTYNHPRSFQEEISLSNSDILNTPSILEKQ